MHIFGKELASDTSEKPKKCRAGPMRLQGANTWKELPVSRRRLIQNPIRILLPRVSLRYRQSLSESDNDYGPEVFWERIFYPNNRPTNAGGIQHSPKGVEALEGGTDGAIPDLDNCSMSGSACSSGMDEGHSHLFRARPVPQVTVRGNGR